MYQEHKQLNLPEIGQEILAYWKLHQIFEKSIANRPASKSYTFYEGPPSANGMPGIHHVMARSIKDIFCRYKTLKGYQVKRKGGWDTHGLPIELAVEKTLNITKEDIGKKITVEAYNAACRKEVMRYTDIWNDLTEKMGYWVDLDAPYITYENDYIETLWWILKEFYKKDLLYKGYTVQPYSPAAGTGLSSHELNQPGTYKTLKETSIVAQFRPKKEQSHPLIPTLFDDALEDTAILAWTTTPWTLPSNCALAIGPNISYAKIKTFNPYTFAPLSVVLAKELIPNYFKKEAENIALESYRAGDKLIPWRLVATFDGAVLLGLRYHQLMPYVVNADLETHAFRIIPGDFVTTDEGTGIVHTASVFGADDFRVCRDNKVPSVMIIDQQGKECPLVDKQGKFVQEVHDFAGLFVREEYYTDAERKALDFKATDIRIAIKLKEDNKAFDVRKHEHSYPHCWRTDKPILYYPLDSWFIRTTAMKDRMVELNKTINWKPVATGTGRFGNWLENLVDWNLSRSRYWGTPLPIWRTADAAEEICIGSVQELRAQLTDVTNSAVFSASEQAQARNIIQALDESNFDLHRPYVDEIVLLSPKGKKMFREPDLIDVWFDSGAMPYAQWHYPFENKAEFDHAYPADFIAEGVDQTRGWFFTLHAIAVMLNDRIAFKNVISNGLVLDKHGNKMSKRLENGVDPFVTITAHGADATRWYMISNASPWDNLKFNAEGLDEVRRKFFGTLHNTYAFFILYANIDGFTYEEADIPRADRPEIDHWILSLLNSLIQEVDQYYTDFEPTKAARAIQEFVDEHLSNWYVRLCRRRFWKGDYGTDKIAAYQTLYTCLNTVAKLMSPIAPFFSDRLFLDLNVVTKKEALESVHLTDFPLYQSAWVDLALEERMTLAQQISSMVLSLRKKVGINVRQPLNKILLPVLDDTLRVNIEKVKHLILSETNLKDIAYITKTSGVIHKKVKPNFKTLGPKLGKDMQLVADTLMSLNQEQIFRFEKEATVAILNTSYAVSIDDVEIVAEDVPGWQVASLGKLTVALDTTLSDELRQEGIARELVSRIQNLRKELNLELADQIAIRAEYHPLIAEAVKNNLHYIRAEVLANSFDFEGVGSRLIAGKKIEINENELIISIKKA